MEITYIEKALLGEIGHILPVCPAWRSSPLSMEVGVGSQCAVQEIYILLMLLFTIVASGNELWKKFRSLEKGYVLCTAGSPYY